MSPLRGSQEPLISSLLHDFRPKFESGFVQSLSRDRLRFQTPEGRQGATQGDCLGLRLNLLYRNGVRRTGREKPVSDGLERFRE